jgi:nitroreductase
MTEGKKMLELILRRQSDRKYSDKPVEDEKLARIIEAGRMAPSACNAQPWKFVVVTDASLIQKLSQAATEKLTGMNSFVNQAPVLITIVRENQTSLQRSEEK